MVIYIIYKDCVNDDQYPEYCTLVCRDQVHARIISEESNFKTLFHRHNRDECPFEKKILEKHSWDIFAHKL